MLKGLMQPMTDVKELCGTVAIAMIMNEDAGGDDNYDDDEDEDAAGDDKDDDDVGENADCDSWGEDA